MNEEPLECSTCHYIPAKRYGEPGAYFVLCDDCMGEASTITCFTCGGEYNDWKIGYPLDCPKCREDKP